MNKRVSMFCITGIPQGGNGYPSPQLKRLLVLLESRFPSLLWDSGDRPTEWDDTCYPCIGINECGRLFCYSVVDAQEFRCDFRIGYAEAVAQLESRLPGY